MARKRASICRIVCLIAVTALLAPLALADDEGFTAEDLAGRYGLELGRDENHTVTSLGNVTYTGLGQLILHEDGRIEGSRILYRAINSPGTRPYAHQELEQIPQTFTGTYTVDERGMGTARITITPQPVWGVWLGGSGSDRWSVQPSPQETFKFVVMRDGRKLILAIEGEGQWLLDGDPVGTPFKTHTRGVAERQDSPCDEDGGSSFVPPGFRLDTPRP